MAHKLDIKVRPMDLSEMAPTCFLLYFGQMEENEGVKEGIKSSNRTWGFLYVS